VKSRTTKRFRKAFSGLPEEVCDQAKRVYRKFRQDPWHPSLRFKQVHPTIPIYSARVAKGYRVVGQRTENGMVWFWIGSHSDYDKLLSQI